MSNSEAIIHVPKYVKIYSDRHGRQRCYYRRKGFPVTPLDGVPGSEAFRVAYELADAGLVILRTRPQSGFVYVVGLRGFDMAKIGYSTDPERRVAQLESGAGMTGGMVLLAQIPGTPPHERRLHRRFAGRRLFGEWFRLSGEIENWLATVDSALGEPA